MSETRTVESFGLSGELERVVTDLIKAARETGARIERECSGGATATYFDGKLVICHPDIPPHVWDGEKMVRLFPTAIRQQESVDEADRIR